MSDEFKGRPIQTEDGHIETTPSATVYSGASATNAFRLRALIAALKLEKKGIKVIRGRSALAIAKNETGLHTNNRDTQIAALEAKLADQMRHVTVEADPGV